MTTTIRSAAFVVENHGSLFLLRPTSQEARQHLQDHTDEEAQWFAGSLAVEPRYVHALVVALRDAGFEVR